MPYYSNYPDVEIPTSSIYEYIFGTLTRDELQLVAVVDGEQRITYGHLKQKIDLLAAAFTSIGIQPGDVIALHAPNCLNFIIALHAILHVGATATPINIFCKPNEISHQVNDSKAKLYLTTSIHLQKVIDGLVNTNLRQDQIILLDDAVGYRSIVDIIVKANRSSQIFIHAATHLAVLPYSSGTSGKARGVVLTHRNIVANIAQCSPVIPINKKDTVLATLPFFHMYGMNAILNLTLKRRGKLVILPKFNLKIFLDLTQKEKCSRLFITPSVAVALTKNPFFKNYDLSSIKTIICGAAPMDEGLVKALRSRIPAQLLHVFSMTELSPVSHVTPLDIPDIPVGSVGVAIPNTFFKVIDLNSGNEVDKVMCGRTQAGEMLVKGPNVMFGYLHNEEATKATITSDGYLHTGDIVEVGPQGEVYIIDRIKDLMKFKGYQVPPTELKVNY